MLIMINHSSSHVASHKHLFQVRVTLGNLLMLIPQQSWQICDHKHREFVPSLFNSLQPLVTTQTSK